MVFEFILSQNALKNDRKEANRPISLWDISHRILKRCSLLRSKGQMSLTLVTYNWNIKGIVTSVRKAMEIRKFAFRNNVYAPLALQHVQRALLFSDERYRFWKIIKVFTVNLSQWMTFVVYPSVPLYLKYLNTVYWTALESFSYHAIINLGLRNTIAVLMRYTHWKLLSIIT